LEATQLHWIANFIWGIADDVLRDLYVSGKYRDVIRGQPHSYLHKPQPLRSPDEIRPAILALEKETEGLLEETIGGRTP
jgi:hypothetical protein